MIVGKKKYAIIGNIIFYKERYIERLSREAKSGWYLQKLTLFGISIFTRGEPQELEFAIDVCRGTKEEKEAYLEIYEDSGWTCFHTFLKKYYFFYAPLGTAPIYSDENSFKENMYQEWRRALVLPALLFPIGLWLTYFSFKQNSHHSVLDFFSGFFSGMFTTLLIAMLIKISIKLFLYRNNSKQYMDPNGFSKSQNFVKQTIFYMIITVPTVVCFIYLFIKIVIH